MSQLGSHSCVLSFDSKTFSSRLGLSVNLRLSEPLSLRLISSASLILSPPDPSSLFSLAVKQMKPCVSIFPTMLEFPPDRGSPAREQLGDFGPAVAQLLVRLVDNAVLLLGPRRLLHLRVEVVVPALAALLADAALQVLGDHRPALGAVLLDQLDDLTSGKGGGEQAAKEWGRGVARKRKIDRLEGEVKGEQ